MAIFDWVIVIIALFVIAMFYLIGSVIITETVIPQLNSTSIGVEPKQQLVYENVTNAWNIIMWIFVFGILLFGFISAQRREPDTGVGGFV